MAEDRIDSIIDTGKIQAEIKFLNDNLIQLSAKIKEFPAIKTKVEGAASTKELSLAQSKLAEELKAVDSLVKQRFASDAKLIALQTDYAKATAANRVEIQKQNAELKTQAQLQAANTGSIERAQAAVKSLTKERNQLNLYTKEGQERQAQLNAQIDKYNNFIKKNVDQLAAQKINVGNYSGAINVLKSSLEDVSKKLETLNKSGKGNKDVISALEKEYAILNQLVNSQAAGFANAAAEVKENQKALLQMEQAGLRGTVAFNELAKATGNLKDDIADLKERTKTLGSDTFVVDSMIQGAQTLAGAYGVAEGAAALFGAENEELQKTFVKLQAIMTVIQGLQSIQNGLQKESAFMLGLMQVKEKALLGIQTLKQFILKGTTAATIANTVATEGQVVATEAVTVAQRAAAASAITLRAALIATGIGAVLVLISAFAYGMSEVTKENEKASASFDDLSSNIEQNKKDFENATAAIDSYIETKKILNRINIPDKDKRSQIDNEDDLTAALAKQAKASELLAKSKAAVLEAENKRLAFIKSTQGKDLSGDRFVEGYLKNADENIAKLKTASIEANAVYEKSVKDASNIQLGTIADGIEKQREDAKKRADDAKKAADERLKKAEEFAKKELAAQVELNRLLLEDKKNVAKAILDDDKRSFDDRIKAAKDYTAASIALINFEQNQSKGKGKNAEALAEQKALIQKRDLSIQVSNDIQKVAEQNYAKNKSEMDKDFEAYKKVQEQKSQLVTDSIDSKSSQEALQVQKEYELKIVAATGEERAKLEKELADKLAKIAAQSELEKTNYLILQLKARIELLKAFGLNVAKLTADLNAAEKKASEARIVIAKDESGEKKKTKEEELSDTVKDLETVYQFEQQASLLITGLNNARYTEEKNKIQDVIDAIDKKRAIDIEAVNRSSRSEQDKAAAIIRINATADAKKQQQELRQRQADEKNARFQKAANIAQIAISTALAIIKAYADGKTLIDKQIGASLAAVTGAVSLATAIATPIPKFKDGKTGSYEGLAIVDDGGRNEPIYRAGSGIIEMSTGVASDRLTHIGARDIVWPSIDAMLKQIPMPKLNGMIAGGNNFNDKGIIQAIKEQQTTAYIMTKQGVQAITANQAAFNEYVKRTILN